jgi:hypothetical protein
LEVCAWYCEIEQRAAASPYDVDTVIEELLLSCAMESACQQNDGVSSLNNAGKDFVQMRFCSTREGIILILPIDDKNGHYPFAGGNVPGYF